MAEPKRQKRSRRLEVPANANESEKLAALNARVRRNKDSPAAFRRKLEAQIEARARERRTQEATASAALKGGLKKS